MDIRKKIKTFTNDPVTALGYYLKKPFKAAQCKIEKRLLTEPIYSILPDKWAIKLRFKSAMGTKLDLKNPRTYNEKLQWLKLYDRRPEYSMMVDKYEVKKYVTDLIGEQYIIPTLGVWDRFEDIDFSGLPDSFVLKCTHDSHSTVICKEKKTFDIKKAEKVINDGLKKNYYLVAREWPYKNVKPRIIAEKYMTNTNDSGIYNSDEEQELSDYKFYCFCGEPKLILVANGRGSEGQVFDYYDMQCNHVDLVWGCKSTKDAGHLELASISTMIELTRKLSKGLPEVRIDFYESKGNPYFGEFTFFDGGGFEKIEPYEMDLKLGSYIQL